MQKKIIREVAPGGGLVTPWTLISKEAKVRPPAVAFDSSEVLGQAEIVGMSVISDYAKIMDRAVVEGSRISEHARIGGNALIFESDISGTSDIRGDASVRFSRISGNVLVTGFTRITSSHIGSNVRILDKAQLNNVLIDGDLNDSYVILGDAVLDFPTLVRLLPGTRVDRGVWTRPPLVIDTNFHTTIEDVDDNVRIGCLSYSLNFWFKYGKQLLEQYGLDENMYDDFHRAMLIMQGYKKNNPSPSTRRIKQ